MDDAEGARCLDLSRSLAFIHEQAMGERSEGQEPLLSREKVTSWATQQEVLRYDIDRESMTIALPTRKVDLRARVAEGTAERQSATVREVLVLVGKLHNASFVLRPGRYIVRRLLRLSNLHLSGAEQAGEEEKRKGSTGIGQKRGGFYGYRVNSWLMWGGGDGFCGGEGGVRGEEDNSTVF